MKYIHVLHPYRGLRDILLQKDCSPQMLEKSNLKWISLTATAKDGGSAGDAGAIHRPTAKDGGSAGDAGAIHRPTAKDGGSASNARAINRQPPILRQAPNCKPIDCRWTKQIKNNSLVIVVFCLLALVLSACGTSSGVRQTSQPRVDPQVSRAAQLYQNGQYSQAATIYRQQADRSTGNRRSLMLLMSAESWLRTNQYIEVESSLALVNPASLSADEDLRYRLIQAEMKLSDNQPDIALALLENPPARDRLSDLQQRYYHYKAEAYLLKQDIVNRSLQLIQLERFAHSSRQRLRSQLEILNELVRIDNPTLNRSNIRADTTTTGWVELSRLVRDYRRDPQGLIGPYKEWRSLYPAHPVLPELLSNFYTQQQQQQLQVNKIAVLLPESGPYAPAARAIRDGILAAWYAADGGRPQIQFYDSSDLDQLWLQVNRATEQGADIIVGPLDKKAVRFLARAANLPVPVLALNQVLTDTVLPRNLYQYSLSPEDEARQVADRAWNKGLAYPGVLVPESELGLRLLHSFNDRWQSLSGESAIRVSYPASSTDLSAAIIQLLNIQQVAAKSGDRRPQQMANIDFIFAIGNPAQIRQVRPMLQYNYAGKLPVFTTSWAWDGSISHAASFDVKDVELPDIPWLVDQDTGPLSRSTINQQLPASNGKYARLYPMGIDAYHLLPHLRSLENSRSGTFQGQTGLLYMDQNQHILRLLTWISLAQTPVVLNVSSRGSMSPANYMPSSTDQ